MHIDVTIKAGDRLKIVNVSVVYDKTGGNVQNRHSQLFKIVS